jgi:hypothetical protein
MWTASLVAAIALAAAAFMLRFLIALLREGGPPVRCWIVRVRPGSRTEKHLGALRGVDLDGDNRLTQNDCADCDLELMENENHAYEKYVSGLIARDVRCVSDGLVWRSIDPRSGKAFREHRFQFGGANRTRGNAE